MKRIATLTLIAGVILMVLGSGVQADGVQSLRPNAIPDASAVADSHKLLEDQRYQRNFKQQPPLIPHQVAKYEIDLKVNQCMRCHSAENAVKEKATEIGKSHYIDRNGDEYEEVYGGRWFCTQCHVAQTDAKPLVDNSFVPSGKK